MRNLRNLFLGAAHTCPRWLCPTFDNPLRRLLHDPDRLLGDLVQPGDRVLDLGPGTGYFTLPLARMVGPDGVIYAADIQQPMLDAVARRAHRHGHMNVRPVLIDDDHGLGPASDLDFALLFWMLHEVADRTTLLHDLHTRLDHDGRLLLVEPRIHVRESLFAAEVEAAGNAGFQVVDRPAVAMSRAALLRKR